MIFMAFFIATACVLAISAYSAWHDFQQFGDVLGAAQLLMVVLGLSIICRSPGAAWGRREHDLAICRRPDGAHD
ncbi:hypothetical protein [Caulobacter sp. UC70_42]|uniref:hypothetical protein n=1 Tax=Caulobacter sp. UC70_42 TaxID=3374551 RepID=UPI003756400D